MNLFQESLNEEIGKKEKSVRKEEGRIQAETKRRKRTKRFGLEAGTGSQGWQAFGGGVWWFRSPPARGASVSGGGPDHELPHPPRATATNPLSPFTTSTATHPTQNPLAGSASLKLLLHVYLIFWRNWNIFVGTHAYMHNYTVLSLTHTHKFVRAHIHSRTSPPQYINK